MRLSQNMNYLIFLKVVIFDRNSKFCLSRFLFSATSVWFPSKQARGSLLSPSLHLSCLQVDLLPPRPIYLHALWIWSTSLWLVYIYHVNMGVQNCETLREPQRWRDTQKVSNFIWHLYGMVVGLAKIAVGRMNIIVACHFYVVVSGQPTRCKFTPLQMEFNSYFSHKSRFSKTILWMYIVAPNRRHCARMWIVLNTFCSREACQAPTAFRKIAHFNGAQDVKALADSGCLRGNWPILVSEIDTDMKGVQT